MEPDYYIATVTLVITRLKLGCCGTPSYHTKKETPNKDKGEMTLAFSDGIGL